MAKIEPCEWCGKGHYTESGRFKCLVAHQRQECKCPPYWKKKIEDGDWATHSYAYSCPLAERSS